MNKIKTYYWHGINAQGKLIKGTTSAEDSNRIKAELRRKEILLLKIREKKWLLFTRRITEQHIFDFTRQLSQLLIAGIPLIQALEISKQFSVASLQWLITKIKEEINSGHSLSAALNKYPNYFTDTYRQLIYAGEQSGTLNTVLTHIVRYQEKSLQLKNKLKKSLLYPITVIVIAFCVIFAMLIFVVPQFEKLFQDFGAVLPIYTRLVISIGSHAKFYCVVLLSLSLFNTILYKKIRRNPRYACKIEQILLHLPMIKLLLKNAIIMRFSRTLATTYQAGLPLDEALEITAKSCGSLLYNKAILDIKAQIIKGETISAAMQQSQLFPQRVVQMIVIAEESGTLSLTLNHIAEFYETELDSLTEKFTKLLEPMIMLIIGVVIGGIIAALYLPIFKLGNVL